MLLDPQDDFQDGELPNGPTPMPPPQAMAPPPPDSIEALKQAQADADKKKAYLGVIGSIAQSMANRPSAYELYTGKKSARPDLKGMSDAAAGAIQNPMDQQQKAFAYLKAKNEADKAQSENKYLEALKDDNSDAAKAFKLASAVPAGMSAYDAAVQGFNPAKQAEIKAKAAVDFGNQTAIHKMDNEASIKKFMLEQNVRQKDKKDVKKDENDNKDAIALGNDLEKGWSARSGQAGQVQGKILAAQRVEALLEQAKTQPGGLDSRQTEELSQATATMIGGGAQASERVEKLVPHTGYGNVAKGLEYVGFGPQGLKQGEFTDRLAETVAREKALAQKQMQEFQRQTLSKHERLSKSNPDLYKRILDDHGLTSGVNQNSNAGGKDPDVDAYAKKHGITYDQALNVKQARESQAAKNE